MYSYIPTHTAPTHKLGILVTTLKCHTTTSQYNKVQREGIIEQTGPHRLLAILVVIYYATFACGVHLISGHTPLPHHKEH